MPSHHPSALSYGSVCSGIEAVSLAWRPLGLQPAWFAEVDPFANAVLAHHYPDIPNLGDMTRIAGRVRAGTVSAPDILVGGTPCQSFSVAGLRRGLDDPRGALTLSYVELAHAIDQTRAEAGRSPAILVWENVSGVLSDRTNAFGHFLGALAGEGRALEPPGGKWTHAGCVSGPRRRIAWRVLDAQYFGVAQRRRRVFLVASGRDDLDPAAVLFECESLRGDPSPGFAPWQDAAAAAARRADDPGGYAGLRSPYGPVTVSIGFGGGDTRGPVDVAACLTAAPGSKHDFDVETFVVQSMTGAVSHTLGTANNGKGCGEDGTGRGVPIVTHPAWTPLAIAQNSRGEIRLEAGDGRIAGALSTGGGKPGYGRPTIACRLHPDAQNADNPAPHPIMAFTAKDDGADLLENLAPTLRAGNPATSQANAGVMPAVVVKTGRGPSPGDAAKSVALSLSLRGRDGGVAAEQGDDIAGALRASTGGADKAHVLVGSIEEPFAGQRLSQTEWSVWAAGWRVRRLMPMECERLQGMPDDYTLVPYRGRPAADAPRYRAIGNSMAVPCLAWIGRRLLQVQG